MDLKLTFLGVVVERERVVVSEEACVGSLILLGIEEKEGGV